jgi:hypothetical protein
MVIPLERLQFLMISLAKQADLADLASYNVMRVLALKYYLANIKWIDPV